MALAGRGSSEVLALGHRGLSFLCGADAVLVREPRGLRGREGCSSWGCGIEVVISASQGAACPPTFLVESFEQQKGRI